ncbi:MAG: c-type cytochrome [Acidobacteriaceae bacterium]
MTRPAFAIAILTAALYVCAVFFGLRTKDISGLAEGERQPAPGGWQPPLRATIPQGPTGESIRLGGLIFNETPLYAGNHTGARISCTSCHAEGGIQPYASPMVGLPGLFPMFNARAGHVISLKDRVQECFVRSENGSPLDYEGIEMKALVDYIGWLSTPSTNGVVYKGRGLITLPPLKPDPVRGAGVYAAQCAGCHGANGEGVPPMFPAVWGPASFNDGAGLDGVQKLAAFVQHNMPQNRMGILSPQDAYDVAAFIHEQPRPAFNKAYAHY